VPEPLQADVAHDSAQPPARCVRLAQPVDVAKGDEESVLNGVLRLRCVTQHPEGQGLKRCAVAFEQDT
jgi:hypothetical protein